MGLELKDVIALAALAISIFNFIESRLAKQRSLIQSFEQRRQEVLLVQTQTAHVNSDIVYALELLRSDCERQWPRAVQRGRPHRFVTMIHRKILESKDGYGLLHGDDVLTLGYHMRTPKRARHDDLVRIETIFGGAKRRYEEAKKYAEDTKRFDSRIRKAMEKQALKQHAVAETPTRA